MPRTSWLLVPALLLTLPACARGGGDDGSETAEPIVSPIRVEVNNNNALAVEIYAVGSGTTHRLGTVHPGMAGHFVLPQSLSRSGGVELQARLTGEARMFRSDRLLLSPGTTVDFAITQQLFNSTATLRP